MLKNYLSITLRSMMKNKVFIFINLLGLGIAIACCIVSYLNWDYSRTFDHNHLNSESIYRVQCWHELDGKRNRYAVAPAPLAGIVKQNFTDVDATVRYTTSTSNIRIGNDLFATRVSYADSAFFHLFTFELVDGSFSSFPDKSNIFISEDLAKKYFSASHVAGRHLVQINQGAVKEFTIGGVFKVQPLNSSFGFEAITLWDNYKDTKPGNVSVDDDWKSLVMVFLKINDPTRVQAVTQQLQSYIEPQNNAREDLQFSEYYLQNFKTLASSFYGDTWLNGELLRWGFPPTVIHGPGIMAVFLLLLACFNFTNTSVAVSGRRLKEIGIRKTMGGVRMQLIAQFLGESLLLCFFALILGILMAEFLAPAYSSMWPSLKLTISYTQNIGFLGFLAGLMVITALIAGTYPAFYITSFKPVTILKGKMKFGGTNWFTRTLLTLQFTISLVCLVCGIAFVRNAQYQRDYHLGYAKTGVIIVNVSNENEFTALKNAVRQNKDVLAVAGSKNHVSDKYFKAPVKYRSIEHQVEVIDIGDDYLKAMGIALLQGRGFTADSENDKRESVLVSEAFVKKYGWTDAIGKRLLWGDSTQLYVIGVVNDILTDGFWKAAEPVMLRYVGGKEFTQAVVTTAPEQLQHVDQFMKEAWKKISPNTVYTSQYNDGNMQATQMINDNAVRVFGFLGLMAALMSATGLFALVSLNILKKMKEIGVRKVLGASASNIARVINMEFIIILTVASLLGGAGGYFFTEGMMDAVWEYYLKVNLFTVAVAIVSLLGVALLSVGYKTVVTSLMNPVNTLRDE